MAFVLTNIYKPRNKCKDGKSRNLVSYYLNGIKILDQKVPFDTDYEPSFQCTTHLENVYLKGAYLYQTRIKEGKKREVRFPVKKKVLEAFSVPKNIKIELIK